MNVGLGGGLDVIPENRTGKEARDGHALARRMLYQLGYRCRCRGVARVRRGVDVGLDVGVNVGLDVGLAGG